MPKVRQIKISKAKYLKDARGEGRINFTVFTKLNPNAQFRMVQHSIKSNKNEHVNINTNFVFDTDNNSV